MAKINGISLAGGKVERDVMDIAKQDSVVGVAEIDRGGRKWDPNGGKNGDGAYVDDPDIQPELAIDLVLNSGDKGFGSQTIGQSDLDDVIKAMEEIVAADYTAPAKDPAEYVPPAQVIRDSWSMEYPREDYYEGTTLKTRRNHEHPEGRCMVSFRTKAGRGAKPAEIHRDRFPELINFLRQLPPFWEQNAELCWENFNRQVAERDQLEAAKAAAAAAAEVTED